MGNVARFPLGGQPDSAPSWLGALFAGCVVVMSIGGALLTSGMMLGRVDATMANQSALIQRDHEETTKQIDALTANVTAIATQSAATQAQVGSLRDSLIQERTDRLNGEHAIMQQLHPSSRDFR
jgi:hypothetical protein